jgi:hypothetical protein
VSNIGDLTVGISCDPSELVTGMTTTRDEIQQTTTVIELQDQTWKSFSASVLGSIAKIVAPVLKLVNTYKQMQLATILMTTANTAAIAPTFTLAAAVNFLLSPVVLVAAAVAACAAVIYYFSGASEEAGTSLEKAGGSAKGAASDLTTLESVTKAAAEAARSLFGDDVASQITSVFGEVGKLIGNFDALKTAITEPFAGGITALQAFVLSMLPAVQALDGINAALKVVNKTIADITPSAKTASTSLAAMVLSFAGLSQGEAADVIGSGEAINKQNAAIKKMEEQRSAFENLRFIQDEAAQSAVDAAEVSRVSQLVTLDAVNAATTALQEKSAATILAGKEDKAWEEQTSKLFDALEKQRQGILSGTVVDRAAEQAKKDLAKVEEETRKIVEKAADEERKRRDDGNDKIQKLRDEIDLLTGAATKGEIALRDMAAAGFSEEQATEVAKLTDELDRLKQEEADAKKKDTKKDGKSLSAAAEFGSKSAFSIIASASSGRDPVEKNTATIAKESVKTNSTLTKLVDVVGDFSDVSVVELPA